jgi:hypothetical protein
MFMIFFKLKKYNQLITSGIIDGYQTIIYNLP